MAWEANHIWWRLRLLSKHVRWAPRPMPYGKPLIVLSIMLLVSILVSPLPSLSLRVLPSLAVGLVLCLFLMECAFDLVALRAICDGLICTGLALGLVAPVAMLPSHHWLIRSLAPLALLHRLWPDSFNPNVVAGSLAMLAPFAGARVFGDAQRSAAGGIWRLFYLLALAVMLFALYLTGSRGAYLATAVGLGIVLLLARPHLGAPMAALLLIIAVVGGSLVGWGTVLTKLSESDSLHTWDQRVEIWARAQNMVADFAITGSGFGCFEQVMSSGYPLLHLTRVAVTHAHNLYLQIAVDVGIPGLACFLYIVATAFYILLAAHRASAPPGRPMSPRPRHEMARSDGTRVAGAIRPPALLDLQDDLSDSGVASSRRMLCAACIGSLASMCLHGVLDSAVWNNKMAFLPWVVIGLAAAIYRFAAAAELAPQDHRLLA